MRTRKGVDGPTAIAGGRKIIWAATVCDKARLR